MPDSKIVLVSACLLGINCRYDGKNKLNDDVLKFIKGKKYIPVCPEKLSGFTIPHPPSEISGGDGRDVLNRTAKVFTSEGKNVTDEYISGAVRTAEIAAGKNIESAILKDRSPACGVSYIHDGNFKGVVKKGMGVTAALLSSKGIKILSENSIKQ